MYENQIKSIIMYTIDFSTKLDINGITLMFW